MAGRADVVFWKFSGTPGITIKNNSIVDWPPVLGPLPTQAMLDTWQAEFDALPADDRAKNLRAAKVKALAGVTSIPDLKQFIQDELLGPDL